MTQSAQPVPRDGRLVSLILASKGIQDADERVIHQLLEFSHRYIADVLLSAQTLSDHANRTGPSKIEKEDVALAIQMRRRYEFFEAPPRDYLASLAHELNIHPLPVLGESFDVIRLPPPHQRLAEVDFELVPHEDVIYDESDDSDVSDEEDENETTEDAAGQLVAEEGEDDDMEEVGLDQQPTGTARNLDEDYDD